MALTQSGENQRKIGVNLSKIIGLKENAEKMKALNMERQNGGFNAAYFNGRNAGTESSGTDPTCTPCGGGGSGGGSGGGGGGSGGGGSGGGGSGGGGVVMPCDECVTLAEAAEMTANGETPCCVSGGKDCDTGENMPICLSENCGGDYGKGCTPPPPPYGNCSTVVITYTEYTGFAMPQKTVYLLSTLDSAEGDLAAALEKSVQSAISICGGGGEVTKEFTANPSKKCNGKNYNISYTYSKEVRTQNCGGYMGGFCNLITDPTQSQYELGLQNWKKPSGKYLINGKFYDACGIEPQDCITVCDENGNQYKICANNGKPKITPVA